MSRERERGREKRPERRGIMEQACVKALCESSNMGEKLLT